MKILSLLFLSVFKNRGFVKLHRHPLSDCIFASLLAVSDLLSDRKFDVPPSLELFSHKQSKIFKKKPWYSPYIIQMEMVAQGREGLHSHGHWLKKGVGRRADESHQPWFLSLSFLNPALIVKWNPHLSKAKVSTAISSSNLVSYR